MRLERHDIVTSVSVIEIQEEDNVTAAELLQDDSVFYQGSVIGRKFSFVAIQESKNGFIGFIQLPEEGLSVEPLGHPGPGELGEHVLESQGKSAPPPAAVVDRHIRRRRAAPTEFTKYLEVLVVVDTTVADFIGIEKVKTYILTLMNIVNTVYHDASLGVNIEVVTVKIMYMEKASEKSVVIVSDPQGTVDRFCHWVSAQAHRGAGTGTNHDVAVLLTRHKFTPAGYAPITGLCIPMRNCALVKDDGFTSAFVIAHEMAHVFGLWHDGHGNTCYGQAYTTSIMATVVQSSFNHYWWSGCSKTKMLEVLPYLTCLNNNPHTVVKETLPSPLGRGWSLDQQCRVEFGERATFCKIFGNIDPCGQMWCDDATRAYSCKTKNVVPLDGTQCGPTSHWYCQSGACGYRGNESPVQGGWSAWSGWSNCSAQCNIGFKRRSRVCTNPKPDFGGKECDGESDNTDTCIAQECTEYYDQRAAQCTAMDAVPVKGQTRTWRPYQITKESDRCKLTCVADGSSDVVTFDAFVDNGTPCSYDDPGQICIDGQCVPVGCDGVRGSDAKLDKCGLCRGNGSSCKTVTGNVHRTFKYGAAGGDHYERVMVLPEGARDIVIKETATLPHFISVEDTRYYTRVLNGDGAQGRSRPFVLEGAWFEYTNNQGHEKLSTKGPVHRNVNVLVYPMDWKIPASLDFAYTIDNNDFTWEKSKYTWKFEDWSPCSVTCGKGVQHIVYACTDKQKEVKVEDKLCDVIERRESKNHVCEMIDCDSLKYLWRMRRDYSACSATCGKEGVHYQLYECESIESGDTVDRIYCQNISEPISNEPCNRMECTAVLFKWNVTSDWSECTQTCGESGTQYQLFFCLKLTGDREPETVENRFCSDLKSPQEPRACNRLPCLSYKWRPTDTWHDCNASCGTDGVQLQKLVCKKYIGDKPISDVSAWFCRSEEKTTESRACNRRDCYRLKWVMSDIWSDCSQTCGQSAVRERRTQCRNVTYDDRETSLADKFCAEIEKPVVIENCNLPPCESFAWQPSERWGNCSKKCGDMGTQTRAYDCVKEGTETVISDENCAQKYVQKEVRECNRFPCHTFEWRTDDAWLPACRKTCQEEHVVKQMRNVKCMQIYLGGQEEVTDEYFCANLTKPDVIRKCENLNCTRSTWSMTNVGECNATCGVQGGQRRTAVCVTSEKNGGHETIADEHCPLPKPANISRPCYIESCYRYAPSGSGDSWGVCSVTCGGEGYQIQDGQCVRQNGPLSTPVPDSHCQEARVERNARTCHTASCGVLDWNAGPWSMCSKTCGAGQKKRVVFCGEPGGKADPSQCHGTAPSEYESCEEEKCPADNKEPECVRDKAAICKRATEVHCGHKSFFRVCCQTCARIQADDPHSEDNGGKPDCGGDRGSFCINATRRHCSFDAYRHVCCRSCARIQSSVDMRSYSNHSRR
ncbi:A disintegrin and metalloproteinase with thrombospondin motifs 2-like [Dreissena polymorpha]|nr:A disintegrin and metalloproteinase with thrombospondin motifs 2-like [Dreissena polymorpha]